MNELTTLRDHAARLATADHRDDCVKETYWRTVRPDPDCSGCNPDGDRVLWRRLADEVDAYMGGDDTGLWEA